jgi:hypothetical protein
MLNNAHVLCGTRDIRGLVHDVFVTTFATVRARLWQQGAHSAPALAPGPLARIVAECAVCGHGSNHVTDLAYSVNRGNTGDLWRPRRPQGRHGRGRARSHKKPERHSSPGSYWIPEHKKVSKEFSKTIICVIYVLSRRMRAPLAGQAAGKWSAGMRLRCFAHNPERELGAKRIFLFGFAVTL